MIGGIDLFQVSGARMRYLAERQNVLSQNIANADTPQYQARDLKPFSFASALLSTGAAGAPLHLAATSPTHLPAPNQGGRTVADKASTYGEEPNGNTVVLEEQMIKQADVMKAYDMATSVFRHGAGLFRIAIGKP